MQLLYERSEESPDVAGLGVLGGPVRHLPAGVRRPQIGWNTLDVRPGSRLCAGLPDPAWLYFVHSFAPAPADEATVVAWCDYGTRFAAAIERGPLWATQFHPEKSGAVGLALLANFVDACA
jgi:glutamine amidotransferase